VGRSFHNANHSTIAGRRISLGVSLSAHIRSELKGERVIGLTDRPRKSGLSNWTGSSSQPHRRQMSQVPGAFSPSVKKPQQGQG
jgi:hypothetical protein